MIEGKNLDKRYPHEYNVWRMMLQRCNNPKATGYEYYGGRGIKVCEAWKSFQVFINDMQPTISYDYSLDRIDCNGHYTKENCRWILKKDQSKNTRSNVHIEIDGETRLLTEWLTYYEISPGSYHYRIDNGWEPVKALTTPTLTKEEIRKPVVNLVTGKRYESVEDAIASTGVSVGGIYKHLQNKVKKPQWSYETEAYLGYRPYVSKFANPELKGNDVIANTTIGICSEAGELANEMRKVLYQGHQLDLEKVVSELGDVLFYVEWFMMHFGLTAEYVQKKNVEKLSRRYPDGFSSHASINRKE